ncbi:hypothetical protein, partial [Klebsiella pneumoniae]|uniref:hypothetical protein n=1 Tax=Klebsiella pneumoniae TaxID=573 RepID=UPI003EBA8C07
DKAWNKARKNYSKQKGDHYTKLRNKYLQIRRKEKRLFEKKKKNVSKCKNEPKLFYRYVNGKMRNKDCIIRLREGNVIYDKVEDMCEIMNNRLQTVFVEEDEFSEDEREVRNEPMQEVMVDEREVRRLMEGLDIRKSMGPDGVANWVLKECVDQLVSPITDIITSSIKSGVVPKEWK